MRVRSRKSHDFHYIHHLLPNKALGIARSITVVFRRGWGFQPHTRAAHRTTARVL
jgi:hypothetical protein